MKKLLVLIAIVLGALSLRAQTNISAEIARLLPEGKCRVDVMGIVFPQRLLELSEQMTVAVSTNKDWWFDYIKKNAKEGEPLPYNTKFGITEGEYEEYLSLADKKTLGKIGSGTLLVKTNQFGCEFDGDSELADLAGIKIDLKELAVTTPLTTLKNPTHKDSNGSGALGAYSGYQWEYKDEDMEKGDFTGVSFLIGRQKESGKAFIYYKGGVMKGTNSVSNVRICICYDKPELRSSVR